MDYRRIYSKKYDKFLMKVVVSDREYNNLIQGIDLRIEEGDAEKLKKIVVATTAEYIPYTDEEKESMTETYKSFVMFEDNLYTIGIIGFYFLGYYKKQSDLNKMVDEVLLNPVL